MEEFLAKEEASKKAKKLNIEKAGEKGMHQDSAVEISESDAVNPPEQDAKEEAVIELQDAPLKKVSVAVEPLNQTNSLESVIPKRSLNVKALAFIPSK